MSKYIIWSDAHFHDYTAYSENGSRLQLCKEAIYKINGDPMVYFKEHIRIDEISNREATVRILHPDYQNKYGIHIHKLGKIYLVYTT